MKTYQVSCSMREVIEYNTVLEVEAEDISDAIKQAQESFLYDVSPFEQNCYVIYENYECGSY